MLFKETGYIIVTVWSLSHGVMVRKLVLLNQLQLSSEFDSHLVLHTFGLVPHLSYSLKITASKRAVMVSKLISLEQL